jgi:hypothetical protein
LVADAAVLPFGHDQDDGVAPGVRHHVLERGFAAGEGALPPLQLAGPILVPAGRRQAVS